LNLWICHNHQIWWLCWLSKLYGSCLWLWISWHEGNFLMPLFFITIGYEMFDCDFSVKTTSFILRGHNFVASNMFLLIVNATYVLRRGLHWLFGHHKQWDPFAKTVSKLYLKCSDTTSNTYDANSQKQKDKAKKNMQLLHL
jgi:hypothetical protein